ncbi:uncharacterized protein [Battus philenor]|uniref:uncharacterized protein n=1 Tax=Battus philenor TaxID=42288 RepID=UPI0035D0DF60
MSALLAERKEKELLQEKIDGMQQTMENVQRQLAGPILQPSREPAELDDNAVVLTPSKRAQSPIIQKKPEFAVPRPLESALYNLFSDSSTEDEAVDPSIVERRFAALARGEKLQPLPLSAFKRRPSQPHKNSPRFSKQARNIVKDTEPKFFKTKRQDSKIKNIK